MASATEHAGRRDTRLVLEALKAGATVDSSGHVDETLDTNWAAVTTRWCEVYTKGSREFFRGDQVAAEVTHKIKIRWDKGLWNNLSQRNSSKKRWRLGARKLNIFGPPTNDDEQDQYISMPCVEVG